MNDLVAYYRCIPGQSFPWGRPFTYLNVEACLRNVPWPLGECVERVTPVGRATTDLLLPRRGRALFSAMGILQLCLFGCTPFRGLTENQVKDVRSEDRKNRIPKRRQLQDCPDRPVLLDGLAGALLFWESGHASAAWRYFSADRDQGLALLESWASFLTELRRRESPLENPTIRPQSLIKAIRDVIDGMSEIQPSDVYHAGETMPGAPIHHIHALTTQLVQMMTEDFRAFGPPTFPQEAIYHAVEDILEPLGVRNFHGKPFTAAGIKKLLRRYPPPIYTRPWDN
jgi:hypothetical protein